MADAIQLLTGVMHADLDYLRSVSNNLANVNTAAYKREAVSFGAIFPDPASAGSDPLGALPYLEVSNTREHSQGALKATGSDLNIAVDGEGLLVVDNGQDQFFTRRGELMVDSLGRLALVSGERLQGAQGDIFVGQSAFEISLKGEIMRDGQIVDVLQVAVVPESGQVEHLGNGLMRNDSGVNPAPGQNYSIHQGYIEASNVEPTREVLKMIELVRHFETSSRLLQAYDQMLDTSISSLGQF